MSGSRDSELESVYEAMRSAFRARPGRPYTEENRHFGWIVEGNGKRGTQRSVVVTIDDTDVLERFLRRLARTYHCKLEGKNSVSVTAKPIR